MKKTLQMRGRPSTQSGMMLLEALIGILIFSLGVLALVAMQSVSVSNVSNAKYRVEAAFYADEIIHKAWLEAFDPTKNPPIAAAPLLGVNDYELPGGTSAQLFLWVAKLNSPQGLPGAGTYPASIHIENVVTAPGAPATKRMTVTVRWKAPDALTPSNHVAVGYISEP
jgi:type IV pilus assembly protein PilV